MPFENQIETRISTSKKDVPETDLDFYAKPENYEGSNIHTLNKFVFTKKKLGPRQENEKQGMDDKMAALYSRYSDVDDQNGVGNDPATSLPGNHTHGNTPASSAPNYNPMDTIKRTHTTVTSESTHNTNNERESQSRLHSRRRSVTAPPAEHRSLLQSPSIVTMAENDYVTGSPTGSRPNSSRSQHFGGTDGSQYSYELAKQRFRHAIKIVLILLRWISTLTEKEEDDGKGGKTFTDIATEAFAEGELRSPGIAFDVSQFKAKKEVNISKEVKHILSIPSTHRTPEQLQMALYGLQHLKSFAEYPLHMQEKLCKVAWYQQVPPKRVIIRQGHYAENFYFILSGQAVVRILDKKPNGEIQLRTASVMRKGTSFGELALLHHSRRTATVVSQDTVRLLTIGRQAFLPVSCPIYSSQYELALLHHSRRTATVVSQDTVQLLTIGRQDFFDIFMNVSAEDGIPEHIKFTASLDFMRAFPMERLLEHPEACLFHFFKRGVVIVKDSNESDWLYIVKSGSCQVMKQLKGVRPHPTKLGEGKENQSKSNSILDKLPSLGGLGPTGSRTDTGLKKHAPKQQLSRDMRNAISQYDIYLTQSHESYGKEETNNHRPTGQDEQQNSQNSTAQNGTVLQKEKPKDKPVGFSKCKYSAFIRSSRTVSKRSQPLALGTHVGHVGVKPTNGRQSAHLSRASRTNSPLARSPARTPAPQPTHEEHVAPVFVQVDTIKPKDVFGLASIQFDDDIEQTGTSVSLVSNGAECIMLSKKFFQHHANEKVKHIIRHLIRPYPTEESLQNNLQTKVDWDIYKRRLLTNTVVNLHIADARRPANIPDTRASCHT